MLLNRKNRIAAYLLILPAAVMLAVFVLYPMVLNISLSFKDYSMLKTTTENVGFKNYITLLSDVRVWEAVQRTFVWTFINVAGALLIGLGAALLLSNGFKGSNSPPHGRQSYRLSHPHAHHPYRAEPGVP